MKFEFKTINEILQTCEYEELILALDCFDEEYSEEDTRAELISRLEQAQKAYAAEASYMLSQEDLDLLSRLREAGGSITVEMKMENHKLVDSVDRLLDLCLVAAQMDLEEEKTEVLVSEEFLSVFAPYLEPERRSFAGYLDEAARMVEGALYYYGAVSLDKLFELVHTSHGNMDFTFFNRVLSYKLSLRDRYGSVNIGDKEYIFSNDYQDYYDLTEVPMKEKLYGYKPLSREELLLAGDPDFMEFEEEFMDLYLSMEDAQVSEELVEDLFYQVPEELILLMFLNFAMDLARKHPQPEVIVEEFFQGITLTGKESLKEIRKSFMDYMNKLPRWSYLGYSYDNHPKKKMENKNVVSMKAYLGRKPPSRS
jgi:hypothetical protein